MMGVSAGTGAMSSLLGKLSSLITGEYKLLKGVRKEVEFLERELGRMKAALDMLAAMEKLDPLAKDWRNNMRELSYDIEDCIDIFMHRFGSGDASAGFIKKTARRLKTLWARHDIAGHIKELKALVMEESQRRDRFELDQRTSAAPADNVAVDPRVPALYAEAKRLVGTEGPRDDIIEWLMDEEKEMKVLSILGCGGLGKTTLAMEVYRKKKGEFQYCASVSVSRSLDLKKLLQEILYQIDQDAYRQSSTWTSTWNEEQLIGELRQCLEEKRYFIIIDDIWSPEAWKRVKMAFPENNNQSRVITTTRSNAVANSCRKSGIGHIYKMETLNDEDSQRLFFGRIFHLDGKCPPHLEEVSNRILKKCGGLPLAIISIASLLDTKSENMDEWASLEGSIGYSLENDCSLQGIRNILLLSYWDLPYDRKTCLLYLCTYPEDYVIYGEELKWKWIAEGFIATQCGAEDCLNELVNRSLIQPVHVEYDGCVKTCRVHDLVLELIISLSNEENFATVLDGHHCNSLPSKIRRLSMQSSDAEHKGVINATTETKLHVRSLNLFMEIKQMPTLLDFQALRVLDIQGYEWLENKHIKNIGSLFQLRYLKLCSDNITEIPKEIGKLQYLETLDLRFCSNLRRLPCTIVRLQKLVRLFTGDYLALPADEFGGMQSLEELSAIKCSDNPMRLAKEIRHLKKLRKLTIHVPLITYNSDTEFLQLLASSLNELGKYNLRYLHTDGQIGQYLFGDPCCALPHLQNLNIEHWIATVPKGLVSLKNLVRLYILALEFDEEALHVLMGMPSLTHLQLGVFSDPKEKLTVGSHGFKHLKVFHYELRTSHIKSLVFAPGSMPALRQLHLSFRARVMSEFVGGADLGIEHLSGLTHLHVKTDCTEATKGEVEAVESSIEKAIALNPNRHTIQVQVHRSCDGRMYKDDEEREEHYSSERPYRNNPEWENMLDVKMGLHESTMRRLDVATVKTAEEMAYELLEPCWDERHRCLSWLSGAGPQSLILRIPREHWPLDQRYIPLLRDTGLLPIARMLDVPHAFQFDAALLSALVDRWRPETHTFHFRWGEMTVTLQDVAMLTGLPLRGAAVVPPPKTADWKVRLGHRFGHPIPDNVDGVPHGWLRRYMTCPVHAHEEEVRTHFIAYLLFLFGWVLFPTTTGDSVQPSYIHLAESLADGWPGEVPQYSWGSAVLSATYRGLCDASQRTAASEPVLAACYILLQLWSWEHFPVGRPYFGTAVHPYEFSPQFYDHGDGDDPVDGPTMGTRWTHGQLRWAKERPRHVYLEFHNMFETLHEAEIVWWPWTPQFIMDTAPHGLSSQCNQDHMYWLTTCHLVFSYFVEPYYPQRVMRQFGLYQHIPPLLGRPLAANTHRQSRRGQANEDWRDIQWPWTDLWRDQGDTMIVEETRPYDLDTYNTYLEWYIPRTRSRLTGAPPQRPVEVIHEATIQVGLDHHRAARHHETYDRLHRIHDEDAQALHRGRANSIDRLLTSMRNIYDDARSTIRTISCRHRDDAVVRHGHGVRQ